MGGADFRQAQEQDELMFYLWSSLQALRGHVSAETFQRAERELGFEDNNTTPRGRNERI
jgi:hypothetical protein